MNWLLTIIFAHFLFAVVFLIDKYILVDSVIDPKIYTFYVSLLGIVVLFFIPFIDFYLPDKEHLFFALFSGITFVPALFYFNSLLSGFEASRVVPAVGGTIPIFIFILGNIFFPEQARLSFGQTVSLFVLIGGSVLISYKLSEENKTKLGMLKMIVACSLLFALASLSSKYAYINQDFLVMLIWIRLSAFLMSLLFLLDRTTRNKVLTKTENAFPRKSKTLFLANQAMGATGNILFNWVVFVVPVAFIAIVNALQGLQNVFLFVFAILFSKKFPEIFQEDLSKKTIVQKVFAILLIGSGLAILSFQ